ncbi:MAG: hypothetical protein HYT41_00030 [Candidatus Sungbacteria bacterium]|nr:hypothetical protein [Candidatus Sungbacteria bacterium]
MGMIPLVRYQDPFYLMLPDWVGQDECWGYDFNPAIEYRMNVAATRPYVDLLSPDRIVEKLSLIYFPDKTGISEVERARTYLEQCGHGEITCMPVFG